MLALPLRRFASLLACSVLAVSGWSAVVVDDTFADGESSAQNLAANSVQLFNGRSGNTRTDAVGSVTFDILNSGSEGFWYFFTGLNEPIELAAGESLSARVVFSVAGMVSEGRDLRLGLFDSKGTRNTANKTGGMNDATFADDTAYGARFIPLIAPGAAPIALTKRLFDTNFSNSANNPFNKSADFPDLTNEATEMPTGIQLQNGVDYALDYTLERLDAGRMRITLQVSGGELGDSYAYSVVDNADILTTFDCMAYRIAGSSFSSAVTIKRLLVEYVPATPVITSEPAPSELTIGLGGEASFTVGASGNDLTYQWKHDGEAIDAAVNPSATAATLQIANATLASAGQYTVVISNSGGSVESAPATLTVSSGPVEDPPTITEQPAPLSALVGSSVELSVTATGENLTYQWYKDEEVMAGENASTLAFAALQVADMGSYRVRIANGGGSLNSETVSVVALSPMTTISRAPNASRAWCVDTDLFLEFSESPALGSAGAIEVRDAATDAVVASFDVTVPVRSKVIGGRAMNYRAIDIDGARVQLSIHEDDALEYGKTYYIVIDEGAFVDSAGAYFAGIVDSQTWRFAVKSTPPSISASSFVVAADGSGDFQTVQGAIDFIGANDAARKTITLRNGVYTELVNVPAAANKLTLQGESRQGVILQYANSNNFNPAGTRYRASFGMDANEFILQNLTIRNTTPKGGSQAEAFRTENTVQRIYARHVDFYSFQDTILAGGQVYFDECLVFGDVDFMWGYGGVYFNKCELRTSYRSPVYYTQIRNDEGKPGFIYVDCSVTEDDAETPRDPYAYLSRIDPSAFPFSQVAWINCRMGDHILPVGWKLDNVTEGPSLRFWEYQSTDLEGQPLDVTQRLAASHQMSDVEALFWRDPLNAIGWAPAIEPLLLSHPSDLALYVGSRAEFSVAATGSGALAYQWFKDGVAIDGAASATYVIEQASADDAGQYAVAVTNENGVTLSLAGALEINASADPYTLFLVGYGIDPETADAAKDADYEGDGVANLLEFALGGDPTQSDPEILPVLTQTVVDGAARLRFEFARRLSDVSGVAVTAQISVGLSDWTAIGDGLAGAVVATEPIDEAFESVVITLPLETSQQVFIRLAATYALAPVLSSEPSDRSIAPGSDLNLSVQVSGEGTCAYQWYKDAVAIEGATAASLQITAVDGEDEGVYTVKVSNAFGSTTSAGAMVTVTNVPAATAFELVGFASLGSGLTGGGPVDLANPGSNYKVIDAETANPAQTLKSYLESADALVIDIQTDVDIGVLKNLSTQPVLHPELIASGVGRINVASNKTLISSTGSAIRHGSLRIDDASNVIIRNIKFRGLWEWDEATQGDYDLQGWDYLEITGSSAANVWVDHCDFGKAYDGQTDVVRGADLVTISWSRYSGDVEETVTAQIDALETKYQANASDPAIAYYASLRQGGKTKEAIIAAELPQKKSQLVGNSDDAGATDAPGGLVKLNVTSHHNWFDRVKDRGPRMRFGNAHVFNNYYDTGSIGANATMNSVVLVENTYFHEIATPLRYTADQNGKIAARDSIFVKNGVVSTDFSSQQSVAPEAVVFNEPKDFAWTDRAKLPYSYTLDTVDYTKNHPQLIGVIEPASPADAARLRAALLTQP